MVLCGYIKTIQQKHNVTRDWSNCRQDSSDFTFPQDSRYRGFYFLPFDNDIEKGGLPFKIRLNRVGRMVKAKRSSYKYVYKIDGIYIYPRTEENLLRRKVGEYFKNIEVTGVGGW